jgi:hypothetical protein
MEKIKQFSKEANLRESIFLEKLSENEIPLDTFKMMMSSFTYVINFWNQYIGLLLFRLYKDEDRKIALKIFNSNSRGLMSCSYFNEFLKSNNIPISPRIDRFCLTLNSEMVRVHNTTELLNYIATLMYMHYYIQIVYDYFSVYLNKHDIIYFENENKFEYETLYELLMNNRVECDEAFKFGAQRAYDLLEEYLTTFYFKTCFDNVRIESTNIN